MILFFLIAGLIVFLTLGFYFYRRQNQIGRLGGNISRSKVFWLFWALFYYFLLSVWIYFSFVTSEFSFVLLFFSLAMFFRAFVQPVLMYFFKIWTPYFGISFNIIVAAVVSTLVLYEFNHIKQLTAISQIHAFYLLGVVLALLTDSYYAYSFYRIVGQRTKGREAIWYASESDPVFYRINRITYRLNIFYLVYLNFLLILIFRFWYT